MMSEEFKADYFRMTGEKYVGSLTDWFKVFMKHNLKYMWLYRNIVKSRLCSGVTDFIDFQKNTVLKFCPNSAARTLSRSSFQHYGWQRCCDRRMLQSS